MKQYIAEITPSIVPVDATKERTFAVIEAIDYTEKMVMASKEAMITLRDRLSSVLSDDRAVSAAPKDARVSCSLSLRIYNIGDTANELFEDIMDLVDRLEF